MTTAESGYPAGSYRLNNGSYFLSERYTFAGRNFEKKSTKSKCCIRAATLLMAWWMWFHQTFQSSNRHQYYIIHSNCPSSVSCMNDADDDDAEWIHGYRQWCTSNLHALMTWLNACQRSWDGVWLSRVCCSLTYSTLTHLRNFAEKTVWWLSQLLNVK